MDQIKIGKFIAECRKKNNLTQMQLAEKLNITDRAISKWENGKGMPDSSIMLDLCKELKISVNELLSGELIDMNEYDKKADELLIELTRQEENKNKRIIADMWVLIITTMIFYIGITLLAYYCLKKGTLLGIIVGVSTLIMVVVAFYGVKLEVNAGYYECKNCHHKYVPSYFTALITPHVNTLRYLKCPKCHKRNWAKKVMSKKGE